MMTASVYQPKTASPTSLGLVVLIHGAALAALALAKMDMPTPPIFTPTKVELITVKPVPREVPVEPREKQPRQQIRYVPPIVDAEPPRPADSVSTTTETKPTFVDPGPPEKTFDPVPEARPIPEPV